MTLKEKICNLFTVFAYNIALFLLGLAFIPKFLYSLIVHKKYRKSFFARLGKGFPRINKGTSPLIWIHAVSFGETKAVAPLARQLKQQYPDAQFIVSSLTETGHDEAVRSLSFADHHVYMPLDIPFIVSKVISRASPDLLILCESDFWFNFLRRTKKQGASIVLVNGKISERSLDRFKKVRFFSEKLFDLFALMCLQNQIYYNRFIGLNIPADKLAITGNLKLDDEYPMLSSEEIRQWRDRLGIAEGDLVLTIGSTHNPEEQICISALKVVWQKQPNLKVILVPRHPERCKEVVNLLEREQVPFTKFTEISGRTGKERVILIDTIGMLRMCYQLSDIALVAGSFTQRVGGHNILEPCWYGKPVLFGPHMHTQTELVNLISGYEAGFQIGEEELPSTILKLSKDAALREEIGRRGLRLIQESKGSVNRTLATLKPILDTIRNRYKNK